jgi:hypothetical protein
MKKTSRKASFFISFLLACVVTGSVYPEKPADAEDFEIINELEILKKIGMEIGEPVGIKVTENEKRAHVKEESKNIDHRTKHQRSVTVTVSSGTAVSGKAVFTQKYLTLFSNESGHDESRREIAIDEISSIELSRWEEQMEYQISGKKYFLPALCKVATKKSYVFNGKCSVEDMMQIVLEHNSSYSRLFTYYTERQSPEVQSAAATESTEEKGEEKRDDVISRIEFIEGDNVPKDAKGA